MTLTHTFRDNTLIIKAEDDAFEEKQASALKKQALEVMTEKGSHSVVFDLYRVHSIDSTGLGVLVSLLMILNNQGGDLKLARMNKEVRAVFELVTMHKVFDIFNTVDDAVRAFQK